MLESLFRKLTEKPDTGDEPGTDPRTAFTALLVEAARADEDYTEKEQHMIDALLARHFDLDAADAAVLRSRAETAQAEATDIHRFTSVVKNTFTPEEQISLIEGMWQVILSDETRDPFEDALIRRLGGLLHFTDAEMQAARRRVAQ